MKGKTKGLELSNQNSSEARHRRMATQPQFEMNSKRIPNLVNDHPSKLPNNIHSGLKEDMIVDVDNMCFKSPFKRRGEIAQFQRNIVEDDEEDEKDDLEFKPQYSMSPTAAVMHPIA